MPSVMFWDQEICKIEHFLELQTVFKHMYESILCFHFEILHLRNKAEYDVKTLSSKDSKDF